MEVSLFSSLTDLTTFTENVHDESPHIFYHLLLLIIPSLLLHVCFRSLCEL